MACLLMGMLFTGVVSTAAHVNGTKRGAIYARFSSRFQHSIEDQVRACRQWAEKNGVVVDDDRIYIDEAKTGRTHKRAGFQRFLAALENDEFDVAIFFATNRLYRKIYRSLQFVEESIIDKNKRCVFVAQGIDTSNSEFWRALLQVFAMLDEIQVQVIGGQVHAAHEGLALEDLIWGTITFGYTGIEVEGRLTKLGKPRRKWAIDDEVAKWVRKIFSWYIGERYSMEWIARELCRLGAPLPPRTRIGRWSRLAVRSVLRNRRYIGDWSYGHTESRWMNKAGYSRQFPLADPRLKLQRDHLRIIDEVTFFRAQELLAQGNTGGGRPKGALEDIPRVAGRLLWCDTHRRWLQIRNSRGALACPECKVDPEPALYSLAFCDVVEQLLCRELGELIRGDEEFWALEMEACKDYAHKLQQPDDQPLAESQRQHAALTASIQFILANPGTTPTDQQENAAQLASFRAERAKVEATIAKHDHVAPFRVPTPEELRELRNNMADILVEAAGSNDREKVMRARGIINAMTGGKIVVTQEGEPKAKRGWLRGHFKVDLLRPVLDALGVPSTASRVVEVAIDFRHPTSAEDLADAAKELFDQGLLVKEIVRVLSERFGEPIGRALVAKALEHWFTSRGLPVPDGRTRRSSLDKKWVEATLYDEKSEDVMKLYQEGKLLAEIAEALHIDRNTVTAIVKRWHSEHGMAVPDGRARRKSLPAKNRAKEVGGDTPEAA